MPKKQTIKKNKLLGEPVLLTTPFNTVVPKEPLQHPIPCPWCLGSGKTYGKDCPKCKGAKVIEAY